MDITRTVIAWDGSAASDEAIEWACHRQHDGGRVEIARVLDSGVLAPDYEQTAGTERGTADALEAQVARVRLMHPTLDVVGVLVKGDRAVELPKLATPDALLVLGRRRHHGPRAMFRFSIVTRVAALAAGPVVVVPQGATKQNGLVIAGVDGSASSVAAALFAADEAERTGKRFVALHVWTEPTEWAALVPFETHVHETMEAAHRQVLDDALAPVRADHPDLAIERRVEHVHRLDGMMRAAGYADLLVVGKHGRGTFTEALLGSVSQTVVLNAQTPVVVVGADAVDRVTERLAVQAATA